MGIEWYSTSIRLVACNVVLDTKASGEEMENNKTIIDLMKQIGLSEYESKAYLSLLKSSPANGYKLSISSNIPRSRIYEVLNRLTLKQMVYIHPNSEKKYYVPVDPDIVLKRIQNKFTVAIKKIGTYAKSIRIVNHNTMSINQILRN